MSKDSISELLHCCKGKGWFINKYDIALGSSVAKPVPEPVFVILLRSVGINSQPDGPERQPYLTYWPARLYWLAESIPWNRFLVSVNVYIYGLCALYPVVHEMSIPQPMKNVVS
jgi:hypothetical protein